MTRHEPGVELQPEQVADGGQNIDGGARGVDGDAALHAAAPQQPRVLVAGDIQLTVLLAAELLIVVHLIGDQRVGIVVGGHADHGVVSDPGGLQLLQQVRQGVFQLQIGGDVALHRLRGVGIRRHGGFPVLGGHGVAPAPVGVSADGHVVGVEGLAGVHVILNIRRGGQLHHLQIGVGPAGDGEGQAVALTVVIIAQIGVGQVAVVVGVGVVVIGHGGIAQRPELVAQREGHVVLMAGVEAEIAVDPRGDDAGHVGELAAGGGLSPAGLVVVGEHEALVGQLVQGGRQLLADDVGGEGLGSDLDEILALEHAGVLVLLAGGLAAEVVVHVLQRGAAHQIGGGGEVQLHLVVVVDHRLIRHRLVHLDHRRVRQIEDGVLGLQPNGGCQTEAGHGVVGDVVVGVVRPILAGIAQGGTDSLTHREHRQRHNAAADAEGLARQQAAAEDDQQHQRQEGQQDKHNAAEDDLQHGGEEVAHHVAGHLGDEAESPVAFEVALAAVFDARQHRPEHAQGVGDDVGGPPGQNIHQCRQQEAACGGEQQDIHQRRIPEQDGAVKGVQQQLVIQQRHREKEQRPQAALFGRVLLGLLQTGAVFVHMGKSP